LPDAYAKPPPYRASTLAQPTLQSHPKGSWVFLTNHAPVLLCVARAPQAGTPDIAEQVQITERATQRILADLIADGYVTRTKVGQRNRYTITLARAAQRGVRVLRVRRDPGTRHRTGHNRARIRIRLGSPAVAPAAPLAQPGALWTHDQIDERPTHHTSRAVTARVSAPPRGDGGALPTSFERD